MRLAKFSQYLHESHGESAPPMGPRTMGMTMIAIGLVAFVSALLQKIGRARDRARLFWEKA